MPERPLCIIPARGGSKRFPRKNLALLAGRPLLAYAIEAALTSGVFDRVCVSSEDAEILLAARKYGAEAVLRPIELATDTAQVKQVCEYLLKMFAGQGESYNDFAVLLVTNPFRTAQDIAAAYEVFKQEDANYLMSLVPYSHPPQRAVWVSGKYVKPYFGLEYMKQTQLMETLYRHDGSIIFAKSGVFLSEKELYGSKVAPFFVPPERSVDVDSPLDLAWAEYLLSLRGAKGERGV